MTHATDHPIDLDHLAEAGRRLTRTVDALGSDDWGADSLLPGWSRAHVVAHLALNGEALRGVIRGEVDHERVPMYASQEQRDADIEELAGAEPAELRERLLASLTTFGDAVASVPGDLWAERRFERTPGGSTLPFDAVPLMRVREIEIHHADLGCGYAAADWPQQFSEQVVGGMVRRLEPDEGYRIAPLDTERTWEVGAPGEDAMVVTGPVAQVAWWLTGRPPGEQVSSSRGELPTIGGW